MIRRLILLLLLTISAVAKAAFFLPDNLPSGCVKTNSDLVTCSGNITFPNGKDNLTLAATYTGTMTFYVTGTLTLGGMDINLGGDGSRFILKVDGNLIPDGRTSVINASLEVGGSITGAGNTTYTGDIVVTGDLTLIGGSTITGNIQAGGTVNIAAGTTIDGDINAQGSVTNNGLVTGDINAPIVDGTGEVQGEVCDVNDNTGPCSSGPTVSRYDLVYATQGLTCLPQPIIVRACADSSCSSLVALTTGFTLATTLGGYSVSGDFAGVGEATVNLAVAAPGNYSLSLAASAPADAATQCNSSTTCAIEFVDTGFLLSSPTDVVAGTSFDLTIQAVRKDDNTGACAAALAGNQTLDVAMSCVNPANCIQAVSAGATALAQFPSYSDVAVNFTAGTATLPLSYPDVGTLNFYARKTLATDAVLTGQLVNPLRVRPASFAVVTDPPSTAADFVGDFSAAPVFLQAGAPFTVTITALNALGDATPNYGNESPAQQPQFLPAADIIAPTDGVGVITTDSSLVAIGSGAFQSATVRFSDVGVIRLAVQQSGASYLGGPNVTGQSAIIGRFIPAYFSAMEIDPPALANAQDDFTYVEQPILFSINYPELEMRPRNQLGDIVNNYRNEFFNYQADWSGRSYSHLLSCSGSGSTAQSVTFSGNSAAQINIGTDNDLEPEFLVSLANEDQLRYLKNFANPQAPFQACLQLQIPAADLTDSDGVCFRTTFVNTCSEFLFPVMSGTEILSGRLVLQSSYASVDAELDLGFNVEYFNGSGFVTNLRDNTTVYSSAWTQPLNTRFVDFVSTDNTLSVADLTTEIVPETSVQNGRRALIAPLLLAQVDGSGVAGRFNWVVNLNDVGLPWLRSNWSEDCSPIIAPDLNPCAGLEFGLFRGNDRLIYLRALGR